MERPLLLDVYTARQSEYSQRFELNPYKSRCLRTSTLELKGILSSSLRNSSRALVSVLSPCRLEHSPPPQKFLREPVTYQPFTLQIGGMRRAFYCVCRKWSFRLLQAKTRAAPPAPVSLRSAKRPNPRTDHGANPPGDATGSTEEKNSS